MKNAAHAIRTKVWLYQGDSSWHFVSISKEDSDEIKKEYIWPRRGFGAIPVNMTVGNTTWRTSIFPDKDGTYLLPLKKEVRVTENIKVGDTISISLEVIT
ncbi:MAG: DUF1905 domain-containing protein [Candidatus Roizmanbacteria bacterium]|nr:DUF1905 domain-containing protein [Candidatus Roizmanbacteria bacterium]